MRCGTSAEARRRTADRERVTGSAGLPWQARHEACARLGDLGRFAEAGDLLNPDDPMDTVLGVQTYLLAGDPAAARRFLPGLDRTPMHPGQRDLLTAAAGAAGPPLAVLERGGRYLADGEATFEDFAVFAVAAAGLDLEQAGEAAEIALIADVALHAVVPVRAAAAAAFGHYAGAFDLLEELSQENDSTDPVPAALALLRDHGHDGAAQALVAFAVQMPGLRTERRRYWAALGRSVIPYTLGHRLLHLIWLVCGIAAAIFLGAPLVVVWLVITGLWNNWVPLPGLDRRSTRILRGYRLHRQKLTEFGFPDVVAFLLGALVGMVGFAFIARNASDNVLSAFLVAGLAVGALSGAAGRRVLRRRLDARRKELARLAASRDLRCRCRVRDQLTGPDARYYVDWHLRPEGPGAESWQVRRCGWSGIRFLDFPALSTAVRVLSLTDGWDTPEPRISPYL